MGAYCLISRLWNLFDHLNCYEPLGEWLRGRIHSKSEVESPYISGSTLCVFSPASVEGNWRESNPPMRDASRGRKVVVQVGPARAAEILEFSLRARK